MDCQNVSKIVENELIIQTLTFLLPNFFVSNFELWLWSITFYYTLYVDSNPI